MAKKLRAKSMGMFSIMETVEKVLATANNLMIGLKFKSGSEEEIQFVKIKTADGRDVEVNAIHVIQAAEAIKSVDRTKRFVCGYHGPFISDKSRAQPATCPGCMGGIMQDLRSQTLVTEDVDT